MGQVAEDVEKWGADVIFGRARGLGAALTRVLFRGLSHVYGWIVRVRLKAYRQHWKEQVQLGTMVVSVGNLTVGGTGKTPVVELLARALHKRGRRVAILSRGYKSRKLDEPQQWRELGLAECEALPKIVSDGSGVRLEAVYAGDEPYMLAKNLEGVRVVVDKDRVNGGRFAVRELEADTLVLDDGLQYLALDHEYDLVLVDQNAPFGTQARALLPRGTLREPARNLCRASHIMITKCQGPTDEGLLSLLRSYNPTAEIMQTTHAPHYLERVFGSERLSLEKLQGRYIAAISAIAVPESFENLLQKLGAQVEFHRTFTDHHPFTQREIDRFMTRCVERDIELIVTTEKDAVRFPRPSELDVDIYFLRIEVEILEGQGVWDRFIDHIVEPRQREVSDWAEERLIADPIGS
ncbi:MAG: tetraacyldisaccharide 4'-kinase [Roseibacillus sp.]